MNQNDEMPVSLIIEGETNSLDDGIEVLCRRSRRTLWLVVRDGRRVVLKGLSEDLRTHPEEWAALRKEYLLGLRADSEGIARVYGFEQHPQLGPVIVMEYVDGIPLNVFISKYRRKGSQPLKLSERRRVAFKIARVLADIHKTGVAHRDLKPDNILITAKDLTPKIIDFGNGDAEEFVIYKKSLGTEQYGAPEQREPSSGGMESDVYSFGKILDELLPEKRFKKLRKACEAENPSLRPDMESISKRLDPARSFHRKLTAAFTGTAAILLVIAGIWYGEKTAMADPSDGMAIKEIKVTDTLPEADEKDTTENRPVSVPPLEQSGKIEQNEVPAPQVVIEEKTVVKNIVVQDTSKMEDILQKYILAADKIILRYGNLGYEEKTPEEHNKETLKRAEEQFKLSDEMEEELVAKGFSEAQRSSAYHALWTHMINENNKIDGVYEQLKKIMQK